MSLLDTVELLGVRSVGLGSNDANVIEFLSPLTIICGPNGAGKTTIIEALKYVTTGELPKGGLQAFIHDTQLAVKARVDASVKLKFRDIRGRCCIVTRRMMQFRSGKGKTSNKSEESTIAIEKEPGELKSLSSKVIDFKKEVLNLLGLPAAILEYVVFCHQEESSWPLDEPKKLKERFDEIFQVTGYVKAIEVLKKELKENQQELKVTDGRLPLLIRQQEEKIELHNEYILLKEQVAKNENEISSNEAVLKEQIAKKDEKVAELDEAETMAKKHDMVEAEKQILIDQLKCSTAPDYDGGIDDLKHEIEMIARSDEFMDVENSRMLVEKEIERLNDAMNECVAKKEDVNKAIVHFRSIQMMRDKMNLEREECVKNCCEKFSLEGEESEVLKHLHRLTEKRKEDVNSFKVKLEEKQLVCQRGIDDVCRNLTQITTKMEMKFEECERLKKDIAALEDDLMNAANSSQKIERLHDEIAEQEKMLETMRNSDGIESKIDELKNERDAVSNKVEMLKKECHERENAEEIENTIKRKNEELMKFEKEFSALKDKHRNALLKIFNTKEPDFPLGERLSICARKVMQNLSTAEDEFKIHEKELARAQNAVSQFSREMDQLTDKIASHKRKIMKVVSHENEVETRLNEVRTLLKKSRQDLGRIDGSTFLYEQWEEEIVVNKCCPLCERSCSGAQDSEILLGKIKQRKQDLPKEAEKLMRKVKDYEEMQNELMEIVPHVGMLNESNCEKEQLQENLHKAEQKLRDVEEEFSKSKSERDGILEMQNVIHGVQIDASLIDNIWKSLSDANRDIKFLKVEVDNDDREKRPLSDVRAELLASEARFKDLICELDRTQEATSERNKLIEKLNDLKERRAALGGKALQLDSLEKSLDAKKNELECCNNDLQELKKQKPIVEQQLQAKRDERSVMQNESKKEEMELLRLLREAEDAVTALEKLDEKLREIAFDSDGLKKLEDDLTKTETEINTNNAKMRELNCQIDLLNSKQERKRRLDDQLRKLELRERIKSLDKHLQETEWHGASVVELRKELSSLSKMVNELQLLIENKKGELSEQKKRLGSMKKTLESSEYSRSKEEFKKEVIKKCVTSRVIEDLANYIKVVDESVVKFHAQKMEEINEVLGSLWEQVYRESDVETIRIKSESIDEKEKKKSYNYRVVMCIDGKEIDMPGRCSAGQKMLASILIRIALSDVFCDRCSVIALDEPTTNLDVLKIENLGEVLADIIKVRCANNAKAFQLIVITHDDRFVDHLRQLCRPEWVYAVSKDASGLSRVKRHRNLEDAAMREG